MEKNTPPTQDPSLDTVRIDTHTPSLLIPFRYTQEEALQACHNYYKDRPLLPKALRTPAEAEELQGGFVPFLLYTGSADFDFTYEAQDTQKVDGDPKINRKIMDYKVRKTGEASYHRIRVNASKDVPDSFLEHIGVYTYKDLTPIEGTQEASLLETMTDIEEDEARTKAVLKEALQNALKKGIRHSYIEEKQADLTLHHEEVECALFPLWIRITKIGRKYYHFAMNGQTGEFYGDLPISQGRSMGCFAGCLLFGGGVSFLLMYLFFLLFGWKTTPYLSYMGLLAIIIGFGIANHVTGTLFRKTHRKEDYQKASAQKKTKVQTDVGIKKLSDDSDKLVRRQMVGKRNIAVKTEEYEGL